MDAKKFEKVCNAIAQKQAEESLSALQSYIKNCDTVIPEDCIVLLSSVLTESIRASVKMTVQIIANSDLLQ